MDEIIKAVILGIVEELLNSPHFFNWSPDSGQPIYCIQRTFTKKFDVIIQLEQFSLWSSISGRDYFNGQGTGFFFSTEAYIVWKKIIVGVIQQLLSVRSFIRKLKTFFLILQQLLWLWFLAESPLSFLKAGINRQPSSPWGHSDIDSILYRPYPMLVDKSLYAN